MAGTQNQIGLKASYGKAVLSNAFTGITFTFNTTPTEVRALSTSWTFDSNSVDFDMSSDGRLRYIGAKTKWFYVSGKLGSGDTPLQLGEVRKNGANYGTSYFYTGSQWGTVGPSDTPMQLSTNDYISFFIRRNATSNSAQIWSVELSAKEIVGAN